MAAKLFKLSKITRQDKQLDYTVNSVLTNLRWTMFKPASTSQRYLHQRQQVIEPKNKTGKREWIIARSLCFYRLFDLTTIPAARRSEALKLKIRQWTPLPQYANYIVWQDAIAQVWIWDAQLQTETQQALNLKSAYAIPETLIRPKLEEGIQLVQCVEGVEAQYWQDGILKHSRWWSTEPSLKQWIDFQRICSLDIDTEIPQPLNSQLAAKPWGYHRTSLNTLALQQESLWILLGLAIFIMTFAWYSVTIFKWQQAISQVEQEIEALNNDATPILTAKTQAIQNKQRVDKLINLNPYPYQLDLMGKIVENLPANQIQFITWRYELGKLYFTIEGDNLDPRQYVKAYEKVNWFESVKTENTYKTNQLVVSMQVKPTTQYASAKPFELVKKEIEQAKPVGEQVITEKIDMEKATSSGEFNWDNVPIPDFNKLRNQ